ncbi:MAG: M1 family aminopeptidase [Weeksellaceae bacterium]
MLQILHHMKYILFILSTLSFFTFGQAQSIEDIALVESKLKHRHTFNFKEQSLNSLTTNNYDVTRYDLTFNLTDTDVSFSGSSTVYANLISDAESIQLDAQDNLNIEQVLFFGNNTNYTHQNDKLKINFNKNYKAGDSIVIEVRYNATYLNAKGITSDRQSSHNNAALITTLSEPHGASSWWIGADNLSDKAEVVNIKVKHDPQYKVGSNGKLIARTEQNDGTYLTHWRTSYPIPAYLVSLGMSDYVEYNNNAMVNGTEVPIINYIYPINNTQEVRSQLDEVPGYVEFFSELIGDYPYKNENYGHIQWNWGGGMEHATMSFQVNFGTGLTAHELAHQWFGDKITCGTWSDIWLNEGFATYFEGLLRRNKFGEDFFNDWKEYKLYHITNVDTGSVYIPTDQLSEARIFNSRLSYNKGAMVLHMLRYKLGDDNFYQAIKNYLQDPVLAYNFATTDDLQNHLEKQSGEDLTEFFADWVYGEGFPTFDIELNMGNDKKSGTLIIHQNPSHHSVDFFETPFEVQLIGTKGESEIRRFELTHNHQKFEISDIPFPVEDYKFNPNFDIIAWVDSQSLGTKNVLQRNATFKIYPNPVINNFFVLSTAYIENLEIYNMTGQLVKEVDINSNESEVSLSDLPKGVYMIQANTKDGIRNEKIIKK